MIIKEGRGRRNTIIGMFQGHLSEDTEGPSVFGRVSPELVNWITNYADWTQDSSCYTFTSCSCGIPAKGQRQTQRHPWAMSYAEPYDDGEDRRRHKRSILRTQNEYVANTNRRFTSPKFNRLLHGTSVGDVNKYPWETLVLNKLKEPCDRSPNIFRESIPDGVNYDICSGSLITNKHILTSAECLLRNKKEIFEEDTNKRKENDDRKTPEYSNAECIFVLIGMKSKVNALSDDYPISVKHHHVHPHAFSHVNEYNYNIGIKACYCILFLHSKLLSIYYVYYIY